MRCINTTPPHSILTVNAEPVSEGRLEYDQKNDGSADVVIDAADLNNLWKKIVEFEDETKKKLNDHLQNIGVGFNSSGNAEINASKASNATNIDFSQYWAAIDLAGNEAGNIEDWQVLTPQRFLGSDNKWHDGKMTNQGAVSVSKTPSDSTYTIPEGYHNGSGTITFSITEGDAGEGDVLDGKTFYAGSNTKQQGKMVNHGSAEIVVSDASGSADIPEGYYASGSKATVDLTKLSKSIFSENKHEFAAFGTSNHKVGLGWTAYEYRDTRTKRWEDGDYWWDTDRIYTSLDETVPVWTSQRDMYYISMDTNDDNETAGTVREYELYIPPTMLRVTHECYGLQRFTTPNEVRRDNTKHNTWSYTVYCDPSTTVSSNGKTCNYVPPSNTTTTDKNHFSTQSLYATEYNPCDWSHTYTWYPSYYVELGGTNNPPVAGEGVTRKYVSTSGSGHYVYSCEETYYEVIDLREYWKQASEIDVQLMSFKAKYNATTWQDDEYYDKASDLQDGYIYSKTDVATTVPYIVVTKLPGTMAGASSSNCDYYKTARKESWGDGKGSFTAEDKTWDTDLNITYDSEKDRFVVDYTCCYTNDKDYYNHLKTFDSWNKNFDTTLQNWLMSDSSDPYGQGWWPDRQGRFLSYQKDDGVNTNTCKESNGENMLKITFNQMDVSFSFKK